jgi:1-acyl-sn-glycerol-3-phosphate acyltransferase
MLALRGWSVVGRPPDIPKMVIIGAPHTSNWDFPIAILAARSLGIRIRFLAKHTLFRWPFGWFFRMLGGIPVDRSRSMGVIAQTVAAFEEADALILAIAPAGTREPRPYWRSGFYEIARSADVPVVLVAVDAEAKEVRVGPAIELTGDVSADMDEIRNFYRGVRGVKPDNAGRVRLRKEDPPEPRVT